MNPTYRQNGFTLIELSIVLIIISLILGSILGLGNAQLQSAKVSSTKQKQQLIKLALINFISRNNRLPCPSVPTLAKGATGYGLEAGANCTGTNISGSVATGALPWSSLGITSDNASDGYYNRFTYQVAIDATSAANDENTIVGLSGVSSTHLTAPATIGNVPAGNQLNDCTPSNSTYNPCSSVVVIVSHGRNGNGAYSEDGVQKALPTGADELENTDNDSLFVIKEYSDVDTNPFDDIVMPLSSSDLLTPLTTIGAIKDIRASVHDDVTKIKNAIIANAVTNRDTSGGSGNYVYPISGSISVPFVASDVRKDAWNEDYIFIQNVLSISSATNASVTAFTIKSKGADKTEYFGSGTSDDYVVNVTVNELQDAFSKAGW